MREARMNTGWQIHVIPVGDTYPHTAGEECWCDPTCEDDGLVIHRADDQRESFERGERKPS